MLLTPEQFREVSALAKALPEVRGAVVALVKPKYWRVIDDQFQELAGHTVRLSSLFATLDFMTVDLVGKPEMAWFQKVARFYRSLMNAILGRELGDASPVSDQLVRQQDSDYYVELFKLKDHMERMEAVFAPQKPRQSPSL